MPHPTPEDPSRALAARLDAIEARLARLEAGASVPSALAPQAEAEATPADRTTGAHTRVPSLLRLDGSRLATALGRSFIILGGAFLLRALTDARTWPPAVGVTLGLLYGLAWMGTAGVASRAGDRLRTLFDGTTALVIGFPLIVEATFRFALLGPTSAAAALTALTAGALAVASVTRAQSLAWIAMLGGVATGLTLMVRLGVVMPYSLYFTLVGVATLWLGYLREWRGLRWPMGALAAAAVFAVTSRATGASPLDSPAVAWTAQAVFVVGYLTSIAVRTLVRGRQVIAFEIVQTLLVLLVGVGGALAVGRATGSGAAVLGASLAGLGAAAYFVSFQFLPRDSAGALNFYFYSSLALVFVLVGLEGATSGSARALALTILAALLAAAWWRSGRVTLGGHAAVAVVAASTAGGLFALGEYAVGGDLPTASLVATGGATLAVALAISGSRVAACHWPRLTIADVPALVIAVVALAGSAGLLMTVVVGVTSLTTADAGVLATIRTALLSALAVLAATFHRRGAFSAIGWLAYPLLAAIGIKVALTDLRVSTAATLFIALACYGAALVLVPRMHRTA